MQACAMCINLYNDLKCGVKMYSITLITAPDMYAIIYTYDIDRYDCIYELLPPTVHDSTDANCPTHAHMRKDQEISPPSQC